MDSRLGLSRADGCLSLLVGGDRNAEKRCLEPEDVERVAMTDLSRKGMWHNA